jgi:hypothetical protein
VIEEKVGMQHTIMSAIAFCAMGKKVKEMPITEMIPA